DLVAAQASRTPEAVAVVWRDDSLTYGALDRQSNRLARAIREVVPQRGCRIAIATGRNLSMMVGLLAIMKAGHAYVPIDRDQPAARQKAILDHADVAAVLCDSPPAWADAAGMPPLIELTAHAAGVLQKSDEALPHDAVENGGERTAYVIFTSGSTGEPKGVEVTHRAFANLLWSMADRPGCTAADTLLAVTTLAFDIAGAELFLPLVTGGRVILADRDDVRDGFRLVEQIGRSKVTILQATPSLWRMLVEAGFRAPPRFTMISGGEALPRDLADRLLEGEGVLWNAYGPTETTIWSSIGRVGAEPRTIGIGEPLFNTSLHVLDARGGLAPVGVAGELHIGGLGLARGYFERPDLTAEAFRERPLPGGGVQRLYHTGDRAKRLADGRIELLGRRDSQIKLFGYRIELGEIEAVLRWCPGVANAAVVLGAGEHPRLVGYYAAEPGFTITDRDLVRHAATALPAAMVPSRWMRLDAMPLTPNGKLDRKALPVLDTGQADASGQKPETSLQAEIARVIEAVLGRPAIGIHDNLFSLGADSIQVFRIAARLREQGIPIPAGQIMRSPTVAELAAAMAEPMEPTGVPSLRSFRRAIRNTGVPA
ncbi:MAG: non-ribosomal peptide synthetase, partial [Parafilimonas terrae]|nr:non-ribosomal peptide synthetase [Parafilimonas terrae]